MDWIDLRSDTVTEPTPEMRQAMAEAEVGDDVFGDDPTVHRLEELAAERMGKPAAVLVASGTMGNLAAVLSHCQRETRSYLAINRTHFSMRLAGFLRLAGFTRAPSPINPMEHCGWMTFKLRSAPMTSIFQSVG